MMGGGGGVQEFYMIVQIRVLYYYRGGSFSKLIEKGLLDVNKREFLLLLLVLFTVIFGIYPSLILSSLDFSMNSLLYSV